jgi:hypothetical protein
LAFSTRRDRIAHLEESEGLFVSQDVEFTPSPEAVEIVARAIEEQMYSRYEWTPEQFHIWWTKDSRNRNHGERRDQAVTVLKALHVAGFSISQPTDAGVAATPGKMAP